MNRLLEALLALVLLACPACKPKDSATDPAPPTQAQLEQLPRSGLPPGGEAPATPVVIQEADSNQVLHQLGLELRKYVVRTRTQPKTFEEFVSKANIQAPPPPAGKVYALSDAEVILKNK